MTAGDGASEQARLANERVKRLRRELEHAERAERAWTAGAAGEVLVAGKLNELAANGWRLLHDVHWPGRPKANLDHVLVGPGGVLVVDAKNWTGSVEMRNGVLFQERYSRAKETEGVLQQGAALAALVAPQHRQLVQAWLCMVGQPELQALAANGVRIQGLNTLTTAVRALPEVLDPYMVEAMHTHLAGLLTGPVSPSVLTTAHLGVVPPSGAPWVPRPPVSRKVEAPAWKPNRRGQSSRFGPYKPRRASKSPGCVGVGMRLVILWVIGSILLSAAQGLARTVQPLPAKTPAPSISRTLPPK